MLFVPSMLGLVDALSWFGGRPNATRQAVAGAAMDEATGWPERQGRLQRRRAAAGRGSSRERKRRSSPWKPPRREAAKAVEVAEGGHARVIAAGLWRRSTLPSGLG